MKPFLLGNHFDPLSSQSQMLLPWNYQQLPVTLTFKAQSPVRSEAVPPFVKHVFDKSCVEFPWACGWRRHRSVRTAAGCQKKAFTGSGGSCCRGTLLGQNRDTFSVLLLSLLGLNHLTLKGWRRSPGLFKVKGSGYDRLWGRQRGATGFCPAVALSGFRFRTSACRNLTLTRLHPFYDAILSHGGTFW